MALHDLSLVHFSNNKFAEGEQPAFISGTAGPILVVCPKTGHLIHTRFDHEKRAYCNTVTGEEVEWTAVEDYYRLCYN